MNDRASLDHEIRDWITDSTTQFRGEHAEPDGRIWMVKFFHPQYLGSFLTHQAPVISTSPGFTWGDGVYVVPVRSVFSAMIYGRVGIMGWMDVFDLPRIFDARDAAGVALYQRWIQFHPRLFDLLTTTVHASHANRKLRNAFRRTFDIDLVTFRPDEFNRVYVRPRHDTWFALSDFARLALPVATGVPYSRRVRECELVALCGEEFAANADGFLRRHAIGPFVHASPRTPGSVSSVPSVVTELQRVYGRNALRGKSPPEFALLEP